MSSTPSEKEPTASVHDCPADLFAALVAALKARRPVALCTVIATQGSAPQRTGARMLVFADGAQMGTVGGGAFEFAVVNDARARLSTEGAGAGVLELPLADLGMVCGGAMSAYIDVFTPTERLLIFGAGHVGSAVAALAVPLGFQVTLVDDRPEWLAAAALPDAVARVSLPFDRFLAETALFADDYAVIVTRGHTHDENVLRALMGHPLAYIGMMGSARKARTILARLREDGAHDDALARVDAPIGLPIGATTPAELAVSIAARLIAVRHGVSTGGLGQGKPCKETPL